MVNVKICCIQSIEEAQIALNAGAYAIGLVSQMPSGPGVISKEKIREIAKWSKGKIKTVLLTALQNADELFEQIKYCNSDIVQLVDSQKTETYQKLRTVFPDVELMQVIHVINNDSFSEAVKTSKFVDYLLLDSGNPKLEIKKLGGTGETHNWEISKKIVENVHIPVFLAGGLNPENVTDAINTVKPFAVDVCSGLRTEGELIEEKVKSLINNLN